jgi:hypothetical protein
VVHGNRDVSPDQIQKVAQRTDTLTREALVDRITTVETLEPQTGHD